MKIKNKWIYSLLMLLVFCNIKMLNAQTFDSITNSFDGINKITPDGLLDDVFDKDGNKYNLSDLKVGSPVMEKNGNILSNTTLLCTSGYFNLYFETNSGMSGSTQAEIDRRNVICQLFSDISVLINSPLTANTNTLTNKVNIWVRDIGFIASNPSTSGILGLATSFYNIPQSNPTGAGGIADNEIWKTILNGRDSYINLVSPLVTVGGTNTSGGTFYHGMMAFNFSNVGYNWNTNLSLASAPTGMLDLYTIALHEVTHALGFASLINGNGNSKFGSGARYYSRYDLFLQNNNQTQNLIVNTGTCSLYDYQFNSAITTTVVSPGNCTSSNPADNTICGSAASYVGSTTVPLYTPNCFEAPSSLSHFEDQCYPTASAPYGNNLYFVMSNANGAGPTFTKRHLTPEERFVLCDLGYNTNTIFGSASTNNYYNYNTSTCTGINVAGINDGITNGGSFLFIGNAGTNIVLTGAILNNDNNASTFECLQDLYDPTASISISTGNNTTPITFSSNVTGTHLLRYIPVSAGGIRGNITYVYVYVQNGNCVPSACNMINNGGFESSTNCGQVGTSGCVINCWQPYICTPDLFKRGCTSLSGYGIPTNFSSPACDSWSGIGNDNFIDLLTNGGHYNESAQTVLNSPIVQNGSYIVNFRARLANNFFGTTYPNGYNAVLLIAGAPNFLASPGSLQTTSLPSAITQLGTSVLVPNDNIWHYYTISFTYTNATSLNDFIIMNSTNLTSSTGGLLNSVYVDDITISSLNQSAALNLPNTICLNQTINDLNSYLSPATVGGIFTGTGVSFASGMYSFSASTAGLGNKTVTYTYTNNIGCVNSISDVIAVVNGTFNIGATASATTVCLGQTTTLTATGGNTYTWQPGNNNGTPVVVTPTVNTTYFVTGTNTLGCEATTNVNIIIVPSSTIIASSSSTTLCGGTTATLTASGASSYTWMPGNITTPVAVVSPTSATIYTVSGKNGCGIISTQTILISPSSSLCCSATNSTIGTSLTSSVNMPSGTYSTANSIFAMQGVITFTANTTFSGYTLRMAPRTKLIINNGVTLTFEGCKLFGCSELWDGIYIVNASDNLGNLSVTHNTTIEDMYNGIVLQNIANSLPIAAPPRGNITITDSKLNKNYISIQLQNLAGTVPNGNPYPLTIQTSTFCSYTSVTSPGSGLKPSSTYTYAYNQITSGSFGTSSPYINFPRAYTGIYLANLNANSFVKVGDGVNSSATNTFDNLDFGINGTNTHLCVYNNLFKNITGSIISSAGTNPPQAKGPTEIGIAVNLNHTTLQTYSLTVGNSTVVPTSTNTVVYPLGNYFDNCNKGISSFNSSSVTVNGNIFNAPTTDIPLVTMIDGEYVANPNTYYYYKGQGAVWIIGTMHTVTVWTNLIRNHSTGIYLNETAVGIRPRFAIIGNNIAAPNTNGFCLQAIQLAQTGGINTYITSPQGNTISNVYKGVVGNSLIGLTNIKYNTITLENTTKTYGNPAKRNGVELLNCQTTSVAGNTLTSNSPAIPTAAVAPNINGLLFINSANNRVECNFATQLGRCFVFQGTCNGRWLANTMQNSYRGLELYSNGVIGMQGGPTYTVGINKNQCANTWTTITQETYANLTSNANSLSQLYLSSNITGSLKTQPTLNFGVPASSSYTTGINNGIQPVSGASYVCNSGVAQRVVSNDGKASVTNNQTVMRGIDSTLVDSLAEFTQLATANSEVYEVFADEFVHHNQQLVYNLVANDSINPNDGSKLDNFYDVNQNTAIGILNQVQTAIDSNDVTLAIARNLLVPVNNNIEQKHKRGNELVLNYLSNSNYAFTNQDRKDLLALAKECVLKGVYVAQARNILNLLTNQILNYPDNCDAEANNSRRKKDVDEGNNIITKNNTSFNLYPNPNNGSMLLNYDLGTNTSAIMEIVDVTGKFINSYNLQNTKGLITINDQSLNNGIYFYRILVQGKLIKTDKVVIIK